MVWRRLIIILFILYAFFNAAVLLFLPGTVFAQTNNPDEACQLATAEERARAIRVQIPIPGVTERLPVLDKDNQVTGYANVVKNMSCYIAGFYRYFAGVAGILATVMIIYGGIRYVVSRGNPGKISEAKDTIYSALIGLVITLGSYLILYVINPNLVTLKLPDPSSIATILQDVNWCRLDQNPTPKVPNATDCGDVGVYPDKNKTECVYRGNCSAVGPRATCIPKDALKNNPGDQFICMESAKACDELNNLVKDKVTRLSVCHYYSTTIADNSYPGKCGPLGDVCVWAYELVCARPYDRVSCSECNTANLTQCYTADGESTIETRFTECDETIPPSQAVYERDTSGGPNIYTAICCKYSGQNPPTYTCKASFSNR